MNKIVPKITQDVLSLVTDPYHDVNLPNSVYPDGRSIYSYTRKIAIRKSITNPFALLPGENWSIHIFTTPLHFTYDMVTGQMLNESVVPTLGPAQIYGPMMIVHMRSTGSTITETKLETLGTAHSASDKSGTRTVSFGYEIHNTTAELYRSGTITQYRTASSTARADLSVDTPSKLYSAVHIETIPSSLAEANQTPNSHSWEAAKGVYAVCLPDPCNEFSSILGQNVIIQGGLDDNQLALSYVSPGDRAARWSPLNCCGTFITDINSQSTFTLDFRQLLEFRPMPTDIVGLQLASAALPVDTLFLKMYKRMLPTIPPGVPAGFNSAGTWFKRIISIANGVIPHVIPFLPPKAQLIASPISGALNAINTKLNTISSTAPAKTTRKLTKKPTRKALVLRKIAAQAQRFSPAKNQ